MDQKLLSFIIGMLLTKPCGHMGPSILNQGRPVVVDASQSSLEYDVVREHAEAMRDLIAERLASNAKAIADAVMEWIKCNARMQPDVVFELCDDVARPHQAIQTQQVSSVDPKLSSALGAILSCCNYSFTPLVMNPYRDPSMVYRNQPKDTPMPYNGQYSDMVMPYASQLQGFASGLKTSVDTFTQAVLSSKLYSPLTELRNCDSKVVIIHDGPDKDKLKAIADEKNMIVLTATTESKLIRPELGLLLMLNAYSSLNDGNVRLFPGKYKNDAYAVHEWTGIDNYLLIEKYINTTDGIRDELARKAPKFLKDFDEDLAVIHSEYDQ